MAEVREENAVGADYLRGSAALRERVASGGRLPRANVSVIGYALLLTINALSLWGGFFPFFPMSIHTPEITQAFFLSQSLAYATMLLGTAVVVYFRPGMIRHALIFAGGVPLAAGSCCLIALMYVPGHTIALAVVSGLLMGAGSAGFSMAWQRYFSAESPERGNYFLLMGTICAPLLFFALYLLPESVPVFVTPLLLVPLCGLCAILATRTIDFDQASLTDIPRDHPAVYRKFRSDYWRSSLAIGALGFCAGAIRAVALGNPAGGGGINAMSMVGAGAAALILLAVWRRGSFRIDVATVFKLLLPAMFAIVVVLPLSSGMFVDQAAGIAYLLFSLANLTMLLQCAQASRDRGISPAYTFGLFGGLVYALQDGGFSFGYWTNTMGWESPMQLYIVAFAALVSIVVVLYSLAVDKDLLGGARASSPSNPDSVEFLIAAAEEDGAVRGFGQRRTVPRSDGADAAASDDSDAEHLRDRLSKRCLELKAAYGLTKREAEILEHIARGYSVSHIAEELVISENTVRTHSKHIYTKLDVHKRQEILDIIDAL